MSPAEAYLMTSLLEGVIRSGTAVSARALGVPGDIAGKTGTNNEGRDAWFVGYSSRLLAVVWVGFDAGRPHGLSGAQAALPIWADFMRQALGAYPSPAFPVPDGITFADVDATNGKLARSSCPLIVRETFLAGTEPERCQEHLGWAERLLDWSRRLREWFRH
jgi:membrane carboxypeptidase/penicillin-binding protein